MKEKERRKKKWNENEGKKMTNKIRKKGDRIWWG